MPKTKKHTIIPKPISSKPRKLSAKWTIEKSSLESAHGLDIDKELVTTMANEIQKEIDNDIIKSMQKVVKEIEEIIKENCTNCIKTPKLQINNNIMEQLFNSDKPEVQRMVNNIDCDMCVLKNGNVVIKVCTYGKYCNKGNSKITAMFATMDKLT